jgi:Zn finger protein HypA/HybF involved in hydrogenase expression
MHEHGIAGDMVHRLMGKGLPPGACRIASVTVRVSELSGVTQEALQLACDRACEEHGIEPFAVAVVKEGLLGLCPSCDRVTPADDSLHCTECGGGPVSLRADEVMLLLDCRYA